MKISLKWLNDYVDIKNIPVEEIVEKLTYAGLEVEEVIDNSKVYDNIVVGYVEEKSKHPNADKLSVCKVNDGKEVLNVVCGAPNVEAGQKIVFAKVGSVIPENGLELKKVKLRGEVSHGMICSEKELSLSDNHEGIMILPDDAEIGIPLVEYLEIDDVVLDIAVTPNRQDALSHIGVARDLAALFDRDLKLPEIKLNEVDETADSIAEVIIENTVDCPRYSAKLIKDVEIKESPEWLKKKLTSIGARPINNIVDITNFVLHEIGQPLHAFDLDKLSHNKIVVKSADEGDSFTTLDSKERKMKGTDLMICDGEKPVAVAGVMGGENSEVTSTTKNILLESAFFRPSAIRKTAKHLGLSTDASYRFERGTDPEITIWAANRAAQLMVELGNGKLFKGTIDQYPQEVEFPVLELRYERIEKILGYSIQNDTVKNILLRLGFGIVDENESGVKVQVPSYRRDVEREIDLIEEIARIYGYDKIPVIDSIQISLDENMNQMEFVENLKNKLIAFGFNEIVTNSLWNYDRSSKFGNPVRILNPQNNDMTHLRTSMIPGLLKTISNNLKVQEKNLMLFETGHIFISKTQNDIKSFDDFEEKEVLSFTLTGNKFSKEWYNSSEQKFDLFDAKGIITDFLVYNFSLEPDEILFEKGTVSNFEYYFEVKHKKDRLGEGGEIKKEFLELYDIEQKVYVFTFEVDKLKSLAKVEKRFKPLLKFPKVLRDFAFIVDSNISAGEIEKVILEKSSKLLKNIKLFDIFESKSIGEGKKSLAFELEYFDVSRTLTEEEVDKDFWSVIELIKKQFNAELRGKVG
ncbi:MAG: phenylalanine--tRNA ligase subunit beta [Melioribacteraceae bacterium]|nr:phenylalanine--tRNA ligase subunit beta [Melioribacteraceae bacterium]